MKEGMGSMEKKDIASTDAAAQAWDAFLDHFDGCEECTDMVMEHLCGEGGGLLVAAENAGDAVRRVASARVKK